MVNFCSRVYDKRKKILIAQMKLDTDNRWNEQGKRFATFTPKQESFKPSEWVIGLFVLHKMAKRFSLRGFLKREKPAAKEEHGESDGLEQWPGFPDPLNADLSKIPDPPKIKKMQIKDKAAAKRPFSGWSKMLRRDALSPTLDQHV